MSLFSSFITLLSKFTLFISFYKLKILKKYKIDESGQKVREYRKVNMVARENNVARQPF